jgi:hypothetical protein
VVTAIESARSSATDKYTQGGPDSQVRPVRQCWLYVLEDSDVYLAHVLPREHIEAAPERHQVCFRQRLYTPLVTIWAFLYQVPASDQSCRAAVFFCDS